MLKLQYNPVATLQHTSCGPTALQIGFSAPELGWMHPYPIQKATSARHVVGLQYVHATFTTPLLFTPLLSILFTPPLHTLPVHTSLLHTSSPYHHHTYPSHLISTPQHTPHYTTASLLLDLSPYIAFTSPYHTASFPSPTPHLLLHTSYSPPPTPHLLLPTSCSTPPTPTPGHPPRLLLTYLPQTWAAGDS